MSYIREIKYKIEDVKIKIMFDSMNNHLMNMTLTEGNKEKFLISNEIKMILEVLEKFNFLVLK